MTLTVYSRVSKNIEYNHRSGKVYIPTYPWETTQLLSWGVSLTERVVPAAICQKIATLAFEHMCRFCHTKRHLHFKKT